MTSACLESPALPEVKREINFNSAAQAHRHREIKVTGQGPWEGDDPHTWWQLQQQEAGREEAQVREGVRLVKKQAPQPAQPGSPPCHYITDRFVAPPEHQVWSMLSCQGPEQGFTHNRCSVTICQLNKWPGNDSLGLCR